MKKEILGAVLFLVSTPNLLYAGGAVAMRQQQQKIVQQQQIAIQQQMMQQQAIEMQKAMMLQRQQQMSSQPIDIEIQQRIRPQNETPAAVATLDEVVVSLEKNSHNWSLVMDLEARTAIVSYFISEYRKRGVSIQGSPLDYALMIDQMSEANPEMLDVSFPNVLRVAAIIQYDFDNGENKDALALSVLGSRAAVLDNRARLGLPAH